VEVSSGEVVRHRLSLAGNRRLNHALHLIAINQVRYEGQGGTYYRKKMAEGKTHREAMRCLKSGFRTRSFVSSPRTRKGQPGYRFDLDT
jgi:hypothetical protein